MDEWLRLKEAAAPHLRRVLTVAYAVGPRKGELLKLEWPDVDMKRREFTLRDTKNGESRVVPMTEEVHEVFKECRKERRLDTQRVFLYKEKPISRLNTAFNAACRRAGITGFRPPYYDEHELETGRGGHHNGYEDRWAQVRADAPALQHDSAGRLAPSRFQACRVPR